MPDIQEMVNIGLRGLSAGAIYALVGIGFNITFATTNIFNFAHGEFLMIGAMVGVLLAVSFSLPLWVAFLGAMAAAVVVGMLVERVAVRPAEKFGHGAYGWFLSTLGASIIISSGFSLAMKSEGRPFPRIFSENPIVWGKILVVPQHVAMIVVCLVATVGLILFFNHTLTGRAMGAVAQDRDGAALRGLPVTRMAMVSFGISGGVAALAGFMVAPLTTAFAAMGALFLFKGFIAAAIGGIPSIQGALFGGLFLGLMEGYGAYFIGAGYRDTVTFAVLLVVLLIRPSGLIGSSTIVREV